jgi:hypothetical protein
LVIFSVPCGSSTWVAIVDLLVKEVDADDVRYSGSSDFDG